MQKDIVNRGVVPTSLLLLYPALGGSGECPINNSCFSQAEVGTLAKATARQTSANGGVCQRHSFPTLAAAETGFWVLIEPTVLAKLKPSLWAAVHSS